MNILVVSAWCPYPADNGSRLRAYHLIRELSAQGHALSLIALGQDDSDLAQSQGPLEELCAGGVTLFPSRFFQSGTWRARLGFFSPKPRMLLDTFQPDAARAINRECRSGKYDVVLALEVGVAHYIPADAAVPCVLDQVEVSSFVREARETTSLKKRLRLGLMVAKFRAHVASLGPRFACWTAVSAPERDAIIQLIGPRAAPTVHVVPNGVDLEHNAPSAENNYDPNAVIYNGALSFYANRQAVEHFANDILPLMKRRRPDAHLTVTGKTDTLAPDDPLRRNASISLTGYVQDIRPVVQHAAVCVVPLRQGGGTRLKILEAMALGVPVVATPNAAEGIAAVSGEHMVVADAPADFADAVLRLMDSPAERARIAQGGRRLVEAQYGWRALGAQLAQILQEQTFDASA